MAKPVERNKRYSAAVLGDGRILPITETCGRRVLREIEPLSSEGRGLLLAGHVKLWSDEGARSEAMPIDDLLSRLHSTTRRRRDAYPEIPSWTSHHDRVLKSIRRMQRILKPRP